MGWKVKCSLFARALGDDAGSVIEDLFLAMLDVADGGVSLAFLSFVDVLESNTG